MNETRKYIDSSFDQADSLKNRSNDRGRYTGLVPIAPLPGTRQVPGQDGFRLADTPQAWIYIQKKEWLDETWTYVATDSEVLIPGSGKTVSVSTLFDDLETARNQLAAINSRLGFETIEARREALIAKRRETEETIRNLEGEVQAVREELAKKGGQTQYDGKVIEIDVRTKLGYIITRKLDWMNDHEKFAKRVAPPEYQVEIQQLAKEKRQLTDTLATVEGEITMLSNNIAVLRSRNELLTQQVEHDTNLLQRSRDLQGTEENVEEVDELQENIQLLERNIQRLTNQIQRNNDAIGSLQSRLNSVAESASTDILTDPIFDAETSVLYAPVTVGGGAYTRYYKSPVYRTRTQTEARELQSELEQTLAQLEQETRDLVKQVRTGHAPGTREELAEKQRQYIETRRTLSTIQDRLRAYQEVQTIEIETGELAFNGVMELSNVSQLNTSVTLEGEGSASFIIENPQNIFFISREDVELALGPDPFLERGEDLEDAVYYRGRFYPRHIVDILQQRKGAATDVGRLIGIGAAHDAVDAAQASRRNRRTELKNVLIPELEKEIEELEGRIISATALVSASAGLFGATKDLRFDPRNAIANLQMLRVQKASTQADLAELKKELETLRNSIGAEVDKEIERDVDRSNVATQVKDREEALIRNTLYKYYVGKTVFQVLDRVYIWMTSPTRTLQRLNRTGTDFYAIEDPSSIALAQQLPTAQARFEAIQTELPKLKKYIESFYEREVVYYNNDTTIKLDPVNGSTRLPEPFPVDSELRYLLIGSPTQLTTTSNVEEYYARLVEEGPLLEGQIVFLRKALKTTDVATGARTFNKIPMGRAKGEQQEEYMKTVGEYESKFLGIQEERLQVFQGVISSVKQTYSNGVYQIHISCKDNMTFLSMSRIMTKPALRADQGPQGILQDPIWRNNDLAGHWKNGILVASFAFVNDEVKANLEKKIEVEHAITSNLRNTNVTSESEGRQAVSPFVVSLPFARIDAANLISFMVTGYPYNFKQFAKNAAFGGRLNLERQSGITDQRSDRVSFFAFLKRQIGEVNDRLGDFEPYIDFKGQLDTDLIAQNQKDLERVRTKAIDTLRDRYSTYIINRMVRYYNRLSAASAQDLSRAKAVATRVERDLPVYDANVLRKFKLAADAFQTEEAFRGAVAKSGGILDRFVDTVVNAAITASTAIKDETTERLSSPGKVVGSEQDIEDLIEDFYSGTEVFLRPFNVVKEAIAAQVQSQVTSAQVAARQRSPKLANSANVKSFKEEKIKRAIEEFIRTLLRLQPEWEKEYNAVVTANANKEELDLVRGDLDKFRSDLEQIAPSLRISIREGPQSTVEKIVRSEKKNFLIISDRYQLDRSIQAYQTEVGRGNFALFQSEWETPHSICQRAADQVDFEFYADEDGNLQFKPPTYNRILKEHFPIISQSDPAVRSAILVRYGGTEGDVLRAILRALTVMSQAKVEFAQKKVLAQADLRSLNRQIEKKNLLTREQLTSGDVRSSRKATGDSRFPDAAQSFTQAEETNVATRKNAGTTAWQEVQRPLKVTIEAEAEAQKKVSELRSHEDRVLTEIAKELRTSDLELSTLEDSIKANLESIELLRNRDDLTIDEQLALQEQESTYTAKQRQYNSRALHARQQEAERKINLYQKLQDNADFHVSNLQTSREEVAADAEKFVSALDRFTDEHRIHRVADYDLISYDFTEAPPRFTHLEITGAPELVELRPNEIYWAGGVDYDNWRQYGFMSESRQKAYFHSGDAARTYLRALLGRERGRIFTGEMSVRGDSKYRVGDCVFIESVGMYYYIMGVSQSLTFGGTYTTRLTLGYGRRIGELIPHPFDVLGKIMIETYQNEVEVLLAREQFLVGENNRQVAGLKTG